MIRFQKPLLSIIIVAGPTRYEMVYRCLRSIYSSTFRQFETIVIDNSQKLYLKKLQRLFPIPQVIIMPKNTGIFGYNVGFANAKGKYILVLDDDSEVKKDTLQKILDTFEKKPASVGAILLHMYSIVDKYYYYQHYADLDIQDVYTFVGGATVFRKTMLDTVGYYDDRFFCWAHEDDLAARMLRLGFTISFEKTITVNHYEDKTVRPYKVFLTFRNKAWVNIKHFSLFLFPLFTAKDFLWLFSLSSIRKQAFFFLPVAFSGYVWGLVTCMTVFYHRQTLPWTIQRIYIEYYLQVIRYVFVKRR